MPKVIDGPKLLALRHEVREVAIAEPLSRWIARLVRGSDPTSPTATASAKKLLRYGAGVRGGQSMVLAAKALALSKGRKHVSFADLTRVAPPSLRHRLILSFEAEAEGLPPDAIVQKLLAEVPELPESVRRIES